MIKKEPTVLTVNHNCIADRAWHASMFPSDYPTPVGLISRQVSRKWKVSTQEGVRKTHLLNIWSRNPSVYQSLLRDLQNNYGTCDPSSTRWRQQMNDVRTCWFISPKRNHTYEPPWKSHPWESQRFRVPNRLENFDSYCMWISPLRVSYCNSTFPHFSNKGEGQIPSCSHQNWSATLAGQPKWIPWLLVHCAVTRHHLTLSHAHFLL